MISLPTRVPGTVLTAVRLLLIIAAATLPFASSIRGDWVYDDQPQILQNHLIQQPGLAGRALLSDVWAFKQADDVAVSNYWRPTFVAWLIVNERAFGLDSPLPWRVALLLLHALVCVLVMQLSRRLGLGAWPAFLVALMFALHPIHVESVAWVSGATDPLLGLFLLGALLSIIRGELGGRHSGWWLGAGLTLYAMALGSKEVAVMMPLLIPLVLACAFPALRWRSRILAALPYLAMAVAFLIVRGLVLQRFQLDLPSRLSIPELLLNAPRLLLFYLGHSLWPVPLSPNYDLRALRWEEAWTWQLVAQWLAAVALAAACLWHGRRSPLALTGLAIFLLILLPAFNLNAFPADQIVHDRYLYVPLLGLLLAGAAALTPSPSTDVGDRALAPGLAWAKPAILFMAFVWGGMAWSYSRIWSDELLLWQRAVDVDSASASSWAALGHVQWQRKMPDAAKVSVERALGLAPVTSAYLLRADLASASGDLTSAERDLRKVLASFPAFRPAIERLALVLQRSHRFDDASALLVAFRKAAPQFACSVDIDLAILSYLGGDKSTTRRLLESAEEQTIRDRSGSCLAVHFHLAQLASEQGDHAMAKRQLERYLHATAPLRDRSSQALRPAAQQLRERLANLAG